MVELICVDPERIEELWPFVEPFILRAYDRHGSQDERCLLTNNIFKGLALVWLVWSAKKEIEAVLVTDLIKEDGELICRLCALSGHNMHGWLKLLAKIESYARKEGCRCVRYTGRPGWQRALGPDYKVTLVQAEKPLRAKNARR